MTGLRLAELMSALSPATDCGMGRPFEFALQSCAPAMRLGESLGFGNRAALLHDIGRVGVSVGIWGKPGPLSEREWETGRVHAYHTERILTRPASLVALGRRGEGERGFPEDAAEVERGD